MAELLDEGRWSSYHQKIRLLEAAVDVLGDPNTPGWSGATVLAATDGNRHPSHVAALVRPASVCRSVAKASAKFSTNYRL